MLDRHRRAARRGRRAPWSTTSTSTRACAHVVGKGRRVRGRCRSARPPRSRWAATCGLRAEASRRAALPNLWLGNEKGRGALEGDGIRLDAPPPRPRGRPPRDLHAHQFRHTAAHRWLAEGGGETDLMRIMGWRSPQMLRPLNGASKADERARDAHRRLALGDKL